MRRVFFPRLIGGAGDGTPVSEQDFMTAHRHASYAEPESATTVETYMPESFRLPGGVQVDGLVLSHTGQATVPFAERERLFAEAVVVAVLRGATEQLPPVSPEAQWS